MSTRKTNIILKYYSVFSADKTTTNMRVKIDSNGLPYIVVGNEKVIITSSKFPQRVSIWGYNYGDLEIVSGQEDLDAIFNDNTEKPIDKSSIRQLMRVSEPIVDIQ